MQFGLDTKVSKKIVTLAVPVIIAMLSQTLINLLDTMMVGRLPGSTGIDGVAGIGVSLPLFWAIGGFLSAIAVGTQAITARRCGELEFHLAGRALTNSLTIAVITSFSISILGYFAIPKFYHYLTTNPNVIRLGSTYCQIRMLGIFSMVTTMSFKAFFDGIGKTHVHLVASIIMNVLNALLNYVLIFGAWGFPRLEVQGAAYASLISTYIGLTIMIIWSLKRSYVKKYRYYRPKNLNGKVCFEICRLSVPSGLATMFVMTGVQFFMWVVGNLPKPPEILTPLSFIPLAGPILQNIDAMSPDLATAASWVLSNFVMLIFVFSMAFGTATATLVGQSMGAKDYLLAERYGWESVKIGMYVMGSLGLSIVIWPEFYIGLLHRNPDVISTAIIPTRLIGSVTALMSAGMILVQALFGAGNSKFVMIVEFVLHFFCLVPLSYVLAITFEFGMIGAWFATATYIVLLSSIMAWKFHEGKWKKIRI
jgi:Na+-driven multidrug efflux pump